MKFKSDEIFFIWDETVDDDREGIESGGATRFDKFATVFLFDIGSCDSFEEFKRKAIEYLHAQNLVYKFTEDKLFVYDPVTEE